MNNLLNKTKKISKEWNIKPTKSKGQNFLINEQIYEDIVSSANISNEDVVLEVGPGLGFLTEKLAKNVKKVIAVELDAKIYDFLKDKFKDVPNIELINEDILNFKFQILNFNSNSNVSKSNFKNDNNSLKIQNYKVVANLPYQITSYFLRKFLTTEHKPSSMVLMLQKEVAERIVAKPLNMSLLAISAQLYSMPRIIQNVSKNDFWPKPKVDSAVIELRIKNQELRIEEASFFRIVKAGFGQKRKMLKNNLSRELEISMNKIEDNLNKANIKTTARAQELSIEDWKNLCELLI